MKKVFILIAVLMLFGAVTAQENSGKPKKSFDVGFRSGVTYIGDYPPLSLYADNTSGYFSKFSFTIDYHRYYDNLFFWGIEIGNCDVFTSAIEARETAELAHLSVSVGANIPITNPDTKGVWEIPVEVKLGPTCLGNVIRYDGEWKVFYRWGAMGGLGFGLNYRLPHVCIGVSNDVFLGGNFANNVTLPDGSENYRDNGLWFYGYNLMLRVAFY